MADKTDEEYARDAAFLTQRLFVESDIPEQHWRAVCKITKEMLSFGMEVGMQMCRKEFADAIKRHAENN